jgi:hypothetical protein
MSECICHFAVSSIQRSAGRSVTAAVGYRTASKITDDRTGETFDYSRKRGVEFAENILPESVDTPYTTEELWNAAETAEKRKDGIVGREYVVAIPAELDPENRKKLAVTFANHLVSKYGIAANVAVHEPSRKGDSRNFHAHIMTSTRELTPEGFGKKTRILDCKATSKTEIEALRAVWAEMANQALEKAKSERRIDPRSFAERGLERLPEVHMGPTATALERKGKETRLGNLNREIREHNASTEKLNELKKERAEMMEQARLEAEAHEKELRAAILLDWAEPFAPPDRRRAAWETWQTQRAAAEAARKAEEDRKAAAEDQKVTEARQKAAEPQKAEEERAREAVQPQVSRPASVPEVPGFRLHSEGGEVWAETVTEPRKAEEDRLAAAEGQKVTEARQTVTEARKAEEDRRAVEEAQRAAQPRLEASVKVSRPADVPPVEIPGFRLRVEGDERRYMKEAQADRQRDGGGVSFIDGVDVVTVLTPEDDEVILAALQVAAAKWGAVQVKGGDEDYRERCVMLAVTHGIEIGNPELQKLVKQEYEKLPPREKRIREIAGEIAAEQTALREEYNKTYSAAMKLIDDKPNILRHPLKYKAWQKQLDTVKAELAEHWKACGGDAEANRRLTPEYAREMAEKQVETEERKERQKEWQRKLQKERIEKERQEAERARQEAEKARQEARSRDTVELKVGEKVTCHTINKSQTFPAEIVAIADESIRLRCWPTTEEMTIRREECYFTEFEVHDEAIRRKALREMERQERRRSNDRGR